MKKMMNIKIDNVKELGKRYEKIPVERSIKIYLKKDFK